MAFQPHFRRIATLPIASILVIIGAATLYPVCANTSQAESEAERYILEQLQEGWDPDLSHHSYHGARKVRASFIANLLTGREARLKIYPERISIRSAVISGELHLEGQEIPYDVDFTRSIFEDEVDLNGRHFAKSLTFFLCNFKDSVSFVGSTIGGSFSAADCTFESGRAEFTGMQTNGGFTITNSIFRTTLTTLSGLRVGSSLTLDDSKFESQLVWFNNINVNGRFSAQRCKFSFDNIHLDEIAILSSSMRHKSKVSFIGIHVTDLFLNGASFDNISTLDFTGLEADFIAFDGIQFTTPTEIELQRMTFRRVSPANTKQLQVLLSNYNAEFYTNLETSLRTHGYPDEADKVFIAKKRAERRENCKSFWHQCQQGAWALSMFEDMLAGYGKRLQNLLWWSLGFLVVGMIVFRSEKGMRTRDGKDAERYEGRYRAFWYSLDLFLPIIKLGEADVWTPKDYRRWANLYRKVHIIIGSLFVPIGLAAWTGIIK